MSTTGKTHPMHPMHLYLRHLTDIGHPATTVDTYAVALRRAAAELPAGLRAYDHELEHWLGGCGAPSTRNVYRAALQGFYRWAVRQEHIDQDPAAGLAPVRLRRGVPRPASLAELGSILEHTVDPVRLWAVLAAYAGARCIEIARLDRRDVTEQTVRLHGKGDRERLVPTHPQLWAAVCGLPGGLIAGGRTRRQVSSRAAAAFDHIGLPDVTMHRLRHLAGTLWQQATGDIRVTQELLGHASVATTMVYTAVSDEAMRRAVLAMPAVTGAAAESSADDPPETPAAHPTL
jgi:integrase/recombinase XerC